jgi:hypothetical protein
MPLTGAPKVTFKMRSRSDLNVVKSACTSSLPFETEQQVVEDEGEHVGMLFAFCGCGLNSVPPDCGVTRGGVTSLQEWHQCGLNDEYAGVRSADGSTSIGVCWKEFIIRMGEGTGEGTDRGLTGEVENMIGGGGIKEGAGDPQTLMSLLAPEAGEALLKLSGQEGEGGKEDWPQE